MLKYCLPVLQDFEFPWKEEIDFGCFSLNNITWFLISALNYAQLRFLIPMAESIDWLSYF